MSTITDVPRVEADTKRIATRLLEFYSWTEARQWLNYPHPQLDGATPVETINRGETARVDAVLERLESDAYL